MRCVQVFCSSVSLIAHCCSVLSAGPMLRRPLRHVLCRGHVLRRPHACASVFVHSCLTPMARTGNTPHCIRLALCVLRVILHVWHTKRASSASSLCVCVAALHVCRNPDGFLVAEAPSQCVCAGPRKRWHCAVRETLLVCRREALGHAHPALQVLGKAPGCTDDGR